jgi:hypothetical protein
MQYKRVLIPIYHQYLHIIISDDCEKEIDLINKKFYYDSARFDFCGYSEARGKSYLILLNKKYLLTETHVVSTISHEAFHVTSFLFNRIGITPDSKNDEPQAYLLSWIVEKVYEFYKKPN